MARDGELVKMQHLCHQVDTIRHPNSSYLTTKLCGMSACGCNNNTIFQKELSSNFLLSEYAGHVGLAAARPWLCMQSGKMATQLNSVFFVFEFSLSNYRVKYYDYIVEWYSVNDVYCWVLA